MNFPKISVIVAVFNGSATIERCLKSIHFQSYTNLELIVMDGGSKDDSVKIIRNNLNRISYWESSPDRGIYHAWNKALSHAKGEWICFLGSDDFFWENVVIEKIIPPLLLAEKKDIRLVYGKVAFINKKGEVQNFFGKPWRKEKSISSHQLPPHPGLFHRSSIFKEHGQFDESYRIAGDYELLLREVLTRDAMFVPQVIVAGIQTGGVSCSLGNLLRLVAEDIAARKKHGLNLITAHIMKYYLVLLYSSLSFYSLQKFKKKEPNLLARTR
jgi:glycosyltransferase involved in cell wall biosynthesis